MEDLALELDTRRRLYETVCKYPGTHMRELARVLDMRLNLVDYHLHYLEKRDLVYDLIMELSELRKTPHLSASTITTYIDCSLQYYFSRVKRLPMEFVSDALSFGTVIHLVLAEFYRAKMAGDRLSLKEVHELYRQFWTREAKDRQEIKYAEGKDFNTYLMEGTDHLNAWFNKLPDDNFSVVAIEEAFVFDVDGIPIPIIGAIDLVEEDEAGTIIITDFKTSSRVYSIFEIDQNPQITRYQMAAKVNGFADREILLKFDCLVKTKNPPPVPGVAVATVECAPRVRRGRPRQLERRFAG